MGTCRTSILDQQKKKQSQEALITQILSLYLTTIVNHYIYYIAIYFYLLPLFMQDYAVDNATTFISHICNALSFLPNPQVVNKIYKTHLVHRFALTSSSSQIWYAYQFRLL